MFTHENQKAISDHLLDREKNSKNLYTKQKKYVYSVCVRNNKLSFFTRFIQEKKVIYRSACNEKKPAWCYADAKTKTGILYNYHTLTDKRGIIPNDKKLNLSIAEKLRDELVHRQKDWNLKFVDQSYVQRAFNGRNYNLKFVQFWIFDEEHLIDNQAQVMVWDLKLKKFTIELASVNNGYRIWLLK